MPVRKRDRIVFCCGLCACFLLSCALMVAQTQPPQYVGSESCQACHEDVAGAIRDSAHGKLAQESEPARQGCEACHGPGSNHVNSGGDKSLLFTFKEASPVAVRLQCAVCHEAESDTVHNHRTLSCLSCHAAHHYNQKKFLLVKVPPSLCTDCHDRR